MNHLPLFSAVCVSSAKLFITLLFCGYYLSGICQTSDDKQKIQIENLLTQFQDAITSKDSTSFNKLFFDEDVKFIGIMSEKTEASIKKKYHDFQGVSVGKSRKFISQICNSPKNHEENFYSPVIKTDGIIATVSFDYTYLVDKKMIQWGQEIWNLVYTENNWLITGVTFSIHFPTIEPCPFLP